MTLPRSDGCTRTSRIEPRRSCLSRTETSSGWSTMPRTRCSSASASTGLRPRSSRRQQPRGQPRRREPRRASASRQESRRRPRRQESRRPAPRQASRAPRRPEPQPRCFAEPPRPSPAVGLLRGGLLGHGLALGLVGSVLERLVEDLLLVALGLGDTQGALGAREALELLPVTGDLEQGRDGLGRLRADAEPVLRPVGGDLDERGLLLGVVLADLLDDPAVPLLAGVDDDDAVVRLADLAHALQANLDGHVCGVSLRVCSGWLVR